MLFSFLLTMIITVFVGQLSRIYLSFCINDFLKVLNPESLIRGFCVAIVSFHFYILLFEIPSSCDVTFSLMFCHRKYFHSCSCSSKHIESFILDENLPYTLFAPINLFVQLIGIYYNNTLKIQNYKSRRISFVSVFQDRFLIWQWDHLHSHSWSCNPVHFYS